MVKRIDEFVSENRTNIKKIDATFVPVSGQGTQNLTFSNNEIAVTIGIEVSTRSLNDSLISGHPNGDVHGSGQGVSADQRGSWNTETSSVQSEDFTQDGRDSVAESLAGSETAFLRETAVGTGTSTAVPTDTALDSETDRTFAWAYEGNNPNETVSESYFLFAEYGDQVTEYGVYSGDGKLFNRVTTADIDPTLEEELQVKTTFAIEGDGVGNSAFTDDGEEVVARTLRDSQIVGIQKIAFGDGAVLPQESDTSLVNELFAKTAQRNLGPESVTAQTVVFSGEPAGQPVDVAEIGVFDNNDNLLWRIIIEDFEKNEDVEFDTFVTFRVK